MNLKKIILKEMEDFEWIKNTEPILMDNNSSYIINLCDSEHTPYDLEHKVIGLSLFPSIDDQHEVNWFNNSYIDKLNGNVYLILEQSWGEYRGGWVGCSRFDDIKYIEDLVSLKGYKMLSAKEFLNLYKSQI